ncbi:hypothetical protein V6N11_026739 [Hibiscus sabdariffa]|uniref:Uncharacterized protein n=1 Tax=Hibiscus sabdariffa TaxID=183260 RepID=A0ABR2SXA1_9ROSI
MHATPGIDWSGPHKATSRWPACVDDDSAHACLESYQHLTVHLKDPGCDVGEHMHVRGSDMKFDDEAVDNIGNGWNWKCWFCLLFVSRMMGMGVIL